MEKITQEKITKEDIIQWKYQWKKHITRENTSKKHNKRENANGKTHFNENIQGKT